jgi:hypothetical protein
MMSRTFVLKSERSKHVVRVANNARLRCFGLFWVRCGLRLVAVPGLYATADQDQIDWTLYYYQDSEDFSFPSLLIC